MSDTSTLASLMIKELGINKEVLNQKIDSVIERMVERRVNSQRFDDLVCTALNRALQNESGVKWHGYDTLNAVAKGIVLEEMKRLILDKMVISVEGFEIPSKEEQAK